MESRINEEEMGNAKVSHNKSLRDEMDEEEVTRHKSPVFDIPRHIPTPSAVPVKQEAFPEGCDLLTSGIADEAADEPKVPGMDSVKLLPSPPFDVLWEGDATTEDYEHLTSEIADEKVDEHGHKVPWMETVESQSPQLCDSPIRMEEADVAERNSINEKEQDFAVRDENVICEDERSERMDDNALDKIATMETADVNDEGHMTKEEDRNDLTYDDGFVTNENKD